MRRTLFLLALPLTGAFLIPSTFHASLSRYLPQSLLQSSSSPPPPSLLQRPNTQQQSPIMNPVGPVQPPTDDDDTSTSDPAEPDSSSSDLTLSDILPLSRSINIFAQLTRDIASITSRLSTIDSANTTLLAPLNSVMQNLPRKPWEDRPGDDDDDDNTNRVKAQDDQGKAAENSQRFVEMHVVPVSPWREGDEVQTLGGATVSWEQVGPGKRVVRGKGWQMEVAEVLGKAGNGEVWAVKGVVNYE